MAKTLYNDSPLTTGGIIQLLKSRGLAFKDETKASHLLDHISYFRFKSYLMPLLQNKLTGTFKSGATFEDAYTLYKFDSALRKLICAEMEKIEISLRTIISQELSHTYSPYWFTDKTLFSNQTKYSGILSLLFKYLNGGRTKRNIANHFGVADTVLESWIHSFVYVRNICAHHSRLWNKTLRVTGGFPKRTSHGFINTRVQNDRVYYILCIIRYMLLTINPNSSFTTRLKQLLQDYPSVDIKAMGFSANWESEPLWNTK